MLNFAKAKFKKNKKAVLSQGGPSDAAVNFDAEAELLQCRLRRVHVTMQTTPRTTNSKQTRR